MPRRRAADPDQVALAGAHRLRQGVVAAGAAFAIAWSLGAPEIVLRSVVVISITAPIAIGVAEEIGGLASLAAAFAVLTGVAGTVMATSLVGLAGIRSWSAQGLAVGVTAHGQGTARMLALDETAGAFSRTGMGLNAVLAAIWLPADRGGFRRSIIGLVANTGTSRAGLDRHPVLLVVDLAEVEDLVGIVGGPPLGRLGGETGVGGGCVSGNRACRALRVAAW